MVAHKMMALWHRAWSIGGQQRDVFIKSMAKFIDA
jgi:hypothetical protein